MKLKLQILILVLITSCDFANNNKKDQTQCSQDYIEVKDFDLKIEEGFEEFKVNSFLTEKILIGEKEKLEGFKSLNIVGYRLYEFDGKGNITASYDISNNYSVYFYDKKTRLVGSENKQHSPPEVYYKSEYHYSNSDSVNQIIRILYKNNEPISKEVITDEIELDAKKVVSSYFKNEIDNEYFFNERKFELIAFKDEMIFCCGKIMEGKNKLTYYLGHDDLIDSLIVEGMESKKKLKFEYEYK